MLVLAKPNNVHSWLSWTKKIKKRYGKPKAAADPNSVTPHFRKCVYTYTCSYWCPQGCGNPEVPMWQLQCPPSGKSGRQDSFPIFPLLHSFPPLLSDLPPLPRHPQTTPRHHHFHLNIFLHLTAGCLGSKEMLCVQSKQKAVEYQQSFIKQLMDLYSLEEPIPGRENPTGRTHTQGDAPPSASGTGGPGKDAEESCGRCRQLVMGDEGSRRGGVKVPGDNPFITFPQGLGEASALWAAVKGQEEYEGVRGPGTLPPHSWRFC